MQDNKLQALSIVEITTHANPALVGHFAVSLADGTACILSKDELTAYGVYTSEQTEATPAEMGVIGKVEMPAEEAQPAEVPAKPSRKKK